jgi:hypothetical protein
MPRAGGVYSAPPGTDGAPDTTIESAKYNALVADLVEDANSARPRSAGGTGATTAVGASDNLAEGSASINSATVTNLAAVNSVNVTISGSNAIEELGTVVNGAKRYITFSGSPTLKHNAIKLILPGGEDFTAAPGDTCVAQSLGSGNWRVLNYTRATSRAWVAPGSETIAGIFEKATTDEVPKATADKAITADLIKTASESGTLTDASTIDLDWEGDFINWEVTISANRTLGNPTNGQPGTYRTIEFKGDSGTDRTLSFANQFKGVLPEILDITNAKWYLLTIRCMTTTRFLVSAQVSS